MGNLCKLPILCLWGEKMSSITNLLSNIEIPRMMKVKQQFVTDSVVDIDGTLSKQLNRSEIVDKLVPGMRIAIAVGSRGISQLVPIIQSIVSFLKQQGIEPFVVPAMGSHGGATAQGQAAVLEKYGVTESAIGVPIISSMEIESIYYDTENNVDLCMDKNAFESDGVIIVNRIKPHTGFRGHFESGLLKMLLIGLGKQKGAQQAHNFTGKRFADYIEHYGEILLNRSNVLFGVGIVENAYDNISSINVLTKDEILIKEPDLLHYAKTQLPKIMFDNLDVLIVQEIGKNISGPGMDPNITHSYNSLSGISCQDRAKRIVVLDLTKETQGAALGIGMADITTKRLFKEIDLNATYMNCLTASITESAKIPMMFDNDREAIQAAIMSLPQVEISNIQVAMIKNTLQLGEIWISESMLDEANKRENVLIEREAEDLVFSDLGNLLEK